jgi:peptidylprolyl isomerase
VAALAISLATGCSRPAAESSQAADGAAWTTTSSGLQYQIVEAGTGPAAATGDQAFIHETMRVIRDTVIVDTWALNSPVEFLVGGDQVIDGIEEGILGMRVGERRRLIVPPALSKRDKPCRAADPEECPKPITLYKPTDTLQYEITLLRVRKP